MAEVHGAVGAYEAGETAAQPGAVARAAIATRVVRETVRRGARATDVGRWTGTAVAIDLIGTATTVEAWP